jgi:hypothetical protein
VVGAVDLLLVEEGEAEGLVGLDLGGELVRGDGEGEVVDAEEAGEGGEHEFSLSRMPYTAGHALHIAGNRGGCRSGGPGEVSVGVSADQ